MTEAREPRGVLLVNKPRGLTTVQAIERVKSLDPALARRSIGYAGRLDPLAEGLLVLLCDELNRSAHAFNHLDKRYEVDVLLGLRTDSFDLLGQPELAERPPPDPLDERVAPALIALEGTHPQAYPPFSAVRVHGRPAFYYARRGEVPDGGFPVRERTVYAVELRGARAVDGGALIDQALADIRSVRGDFRHALLCERWESLRPALATRSLPALSLAVSCSSGTFMRSLAHSLGERLGTAGLALSIRRTRVGPYELSDARAL